MILNQLYREEKTLEEYPAIQASFEVFRNHALSHQEFTQSIGRNYDYAVLFNTPGLDFQDKKIADLGARNGHFGPWLTGLCSQVYVSDYFEGWEGLPDFQLAAEQWRKLSVKPDRLVPEIQDITKLTYEDESFDHVVCTSVIEHMFTQSQDKNGDFDGDIRGIKEMVRILRPGGFLLLSTDMSKDGVFRGDKEDPNWFSGTFWYTEQQLWDRIIKPSGCNVVGSTDFNFEHPDNSCLHTIKDRGPVSPCILALQKPWKQ